MAANSRRDVQRLSFCARWARGTRVSAAMSAAGVRSRRPRGVMTPPQPGRCWNWWGRALMVARPLAVFMRTRKPCVFLRWVLDGWNVRFMAGPLGFDAYPRLEDRGRGTKSLKL